MDLESFEIIFDYVAEPDIKDVILIEGLPGVGNVGKIAADYIVNHTDTKKFANIYSKYFPPQVLIDDKGVIKLVRNELWYLKRKEGNDLVFLLGDHQSVSSEGQYNLAHAILNEINRKFGIKRIFTLGGYGVGKLVDRPKVLGAATSTQLVDEFKPLGVVFSEEGPANGIVGASGLLLGIGKLMGIDGICLMGETSGYLLDPKSAAAIINVLERVLKLGVDMTDLAEKIGHLETITRHLVAMEQAMIQEEKKKKDLDYIG